MRKNIGTKVSYPCSKAALLELSRSCDYNVPFLFKELPLASGIYLYCANKSGSKRVKNIQFYGHEKPIKNLAMILPGVFLEVLIVFAITCLIPIVYKIVMLIYNEDACPIEEYY